MIFQKVDSESYKESFISKFTNFADKAPIVISFATDDLGVSVVHENSGKKYFYPWDYVVPVKSFIHDIKRDLSMNHYPRISRKVEVERFLSSEEQADLISKGTPVNEVPNMIKETVEETYRIDKILVMKDEFIIVNEKTNEQYCYKMNTSAFTYLRNYRSGEYKTLEEAGEAFFRKSVLVNKLNKLAE